MSNNTMYKWKKSFVLSVTSIENLKKKKQTKNTKIHIFIKTFYSVICDTYSNNGNKIFKEEESIEI